jgi:hypothetical protein
LINQKKIENVEMFCNNITNIIRMSDYETKNTPKTVATIDLVEFLGKSKEEQEQL